MAIPKNYPDTSTPLTAEFLLNFCHPIGEVFFTEDDNFNPNNEWGGTWELDTDGIVYVIEDILAMIMYLLLVIVFMPKENDVLRQGSHSPRRNQQRFQRGHAERRGKGAVESPLYRQRCFRCPRGCHRRRRSGQVPGDGRRSEPQDA